MGGKVLKLWSEELLEEGEARGIKKGETRGIKKGEAQGIANTILNFLSDFGKLPDSLCEKIKSQTDLDLLNRWVRTARYAESIEDFVQKIEE